MTKIKNMPSPTITPTKPKVDPGTKPSRRQRPFHPEKPKVEPRPKALYNERN